MAFGTSDVNNIINSHGRSVTKVIRTETLDPIYGTPSGLTIGSSSITTLVFPITADYLEQLGATLTDIGKDRMFSKMSDNVINQHNILIGSDTFLVEKTHTWNESGTDIYREHILIKK